MKKIFCFGISFLLLSIVVGCGSGKGDSAENKIRTNLTTSKISPEVGIVLKLLTGETTQAGQAGNQSQNTTAGKKVLYKSSATSLFDPIPKDGRCQYEGWEKYTPENLNSNTVRRTYIYDWCKKVHPIASHLIARYNGLYVNDQTDPNYQGSDPLRYPYFATLEEIKYMKDYTEEEYESGALLWYTYFPEFYERSVWEFDKMPGLELRPDFSPYYISKESMWISGSYHGVITNGTSDPSDDWISEMVYDNYYGEHFNTDYYEEDGLGYARTSQGTSNGYMKKTEERRKTGERYSFGALYENRTSVREIVGKLTPDGASYYTMDGAITPDSCGGKKFVIKTTLSLYKPFSSPCPLDGEIVVTTGDREVTLRFLENMTVEVDADSDGVVDDTVSCELVVDSGFCM